MSLVSDPEVAASDSFPDGVQYQWEAQPLLEHTDGFAPEGAPQKVLVLLPTEDQLTQSFLSDSKDPETQDWAQFNPAFSSLPLLFELADELGASEQGIFKIRVPESLTNRAEEGLSLRALHGKKHPCTSYTREAVGPGDFLRLVPKHIKSGAFERPAAVARPGSKEALRGWERLCALSDRGALHKTRYMAGVDIVADEAGDNRAAAGMPELSLIFPLHGNFLREFKAIRGIMTPYKYEGKPLAPFAWHVEDLDLVALNHLLLGTKVWFAIPPGSREAAERVFRAQDLVPQARADQAQFMRHDSVMGGHEALRAGGATVVPVVQVAGEIVVTAPRTYHSGFSVTYTVAESVNYADAPLDLEGYQFCPMGDECDSCKIQKGDFEPADPWTDDGTPEASDAESEPSRLSTPDSVGFAVDSPVPHLDTAAGDEDSPELTPTLEATPTYEVLLQPIPDISLETETQIRPSRASSMSGESVESLFTDVTGLPNFTWNIDFHAVYRSDSEATTPEDEAMLIPGPENSQGGSTRFRTEYFHFPGLVVATTGVGDRTPVHEALALTPPRSEPSKRKRASSADALTDHVSKRHRSFSERRCSV